MKPAHAVRIEVARFYNRMPHELGKLPLTYYQTLVNHVQDTLRPTRTDETPKGEGTFSSSDVDDSDGVVSVDVDALIRQGRTVGIDR